MYIYQNDGWPDFFIDPETVRPAEDKLLESRGFLNGLLSVVSYKEEMTEALVESLCSSWAIEGINLSEADIYSSIAKRLGIPFPMARTKTYYDGVAEVLLDAVQNHEPLTIDRILSWQEKIVEADPGVKRGVFRDDAVYVMSGSMKNTEIIYEAPPASEVYGMMERFIEFANGHSYPDLIMSAMAQYYFVAIHPFEDGNGRTARIISDYLLYRSSDYIPAVFVSSEIKMKQREYYALLDKISRGSSMDLTEWVCWFLERLIDAYSNAIEKIRMSFRVRSFFDRMKDLGLNDRQRKFLARVLRDDWNGTLTARKYALITSCHVDTANRDLKKLVDYGLIKMEEGGSKNTHYSVVL